MRYFIILIFFSICVSCFSQEKWNVDIFLGLSQHDKRFFGYPDKDELLEKNSNFFGSYSLSILLNKKVTNYKGIELFTGFGIGYNKATIIRPFDHSYFEQDSFRIRRLLNDYQKGLIQFPLLVRLDVSKKIHFRTSLIFNFDMFTYANNTESTRNEFPYSKFSFNFYSLTISPELRYRTHNLDIGAGVRVINFQRIDRVLFGDFINDNRKNRNFEFFNPLNIFISISL